MTSKLFINVGGGRFEDRTAEYGLSDIVNDSIFIGATFGDYDRDGWRTCFFPACPETKRAAQEHRRPEIRADFAR